MQAYLFSSSYTLTIYCTKQGFFSKFLMGGPQNFRSPSVPDGALVDGGTCEKNPTEAKTTHLMQNQAIFCYFNHEIQLFKVLLSLKVVKFDTKMYNFSNFRGRTSAGGDKPRLKNGDKCLMGDWQNFRRMGEPPVPPGKTPCQVPPT